MLVLSSNPSHRPFAAAPLTGQRGVVLGTLFSRPPDNKAGPQVSAFTDDMSNDLVVSKGAALNRRFWGRFVALLRNDEADAFYVLRDSSGGVPCFFHREGNLTVIVSDAETLAACCIGKAPIDLSYVVAFLRQNHMQRPETGFATIFELQAGERLIVKSSGVSREFHWHPKTFATSQPIEQFDEAVEAVRAVTRNCVSAWASVYGKIMHRLSGGLDSAVVLSCLANTPTSVICENSYSRLDPDSDERNYARLGARRTGLRLVETELQPEACRFERLLGMPLFFKPSIATLSFQHSFIPDLVRGHKIEAFTTGQGGDQVFFRFRDGIIAADRALRDRSFSAVFNSTLDGARLAQRSFWSILRLVWRYAILKREYRGFDSWLDKRSLLSDGALRTIDPQRLLHPWLHGATMLPPGKLMHVFAIADLQYYQEPTSLSLEADTPLVLASAPIVELALRIPTDVHSIGGIDRAVERAAFQNDLPEEIVTRRSKGGVTRHFSRVLLENHAFVTELLNDGMLLKERLIDPQKLRERLSLDYISRIDGVESLLNCVAAEAWLQRSSAAINGAAHAQRYA